MGEVFKALKNHRRELRAKYGSECPQCRVVRPKTNPSILLPGQQCRIDWYRD